MKSSLYSALFAFAVVFIVAFSFFSSVKLIQMPDIKEESLIANVTESSDKNSKQDDNEYFTDDEVKKCVLIDENRSENDKNLKIACYIDAYIKIAKDIKESSYRYNFDIEHINKDLKLIGKELARLDARNLHYIIKQSSSAYLKYFYELKKQNNTRKATIIQQIISRFNNSLKIAIKHAKEDKVFCDNLRSVKNELINPVFEDIKKDVLSSDFENEEKVKENVLNNIDFIIGNSNHYLKLGNVKVSIHYTLNPAVKYSMQDFASNIVSYHKALKGAKCVKFGKSNAESEINKLASIQKVCQRYDPDKNGIYIYKNICCNTNSNLYKKPKYCNNFNANTSYIQKYENRDRKCEKGQMYDEGKGECVDEPKGENSSTICEQGQIYKNGKCITVSSATDKTNQNEIEKYKEKSGSEDGTKYDKEKAQTEKGGTKQKEGSKNNDNNKKEDENEKKDKTNDYEKEAESILKISGLYNDKLKEAYIRCRKTNTDKETCIHIIKSSVDNNTGEKSIMDTLNKEIDELEKLSKPDNTVYSKYCFGQGDNIKCYASLDECNKYKSLWHTCYKRVGYVTQDNDNNYKLPYCYDGFLWDNTCFVSKQDCTKYALQRGKNPEDYCVVKTKDWDNYNDNKFYEYDKETGKYIGKVCPVGYVPKRVDLGNGTHKYDCVKEKGSKNIALQNATNSETAITKRVNNISDDINNNKTNNNEIKSNLNTSQWTEFNSKKMQESKISRDRSEYEKATKKLTEMIKQREKEKEEFREKARKELEKRIEELKRKEEERKRRWEELMRQYRERQNQLKQQQRALANKYKKQQEKAEQNKNDNLWNRLFSGFRQPSQDNMRPANVKYSRTREQAPVYKVSCAILSDKKELKQGEQVKISWQTGPSLIVRNSTLYYHDSSHTLKTTKISKEGEITLTPEKPGLYKARVVAKPIVGKSCSDEITYLVKENTTSTQSNIEKSDFITIKEVPALMQQTWFAPKPVKNTTKNFARIYVTPNPVKLGDAVKVYYQGIGDCKIKGPGIDMEKRLDGNVEIDLIDRPLGSGSYTFSIVCGNASDKVVLSVLSKQDQTQVPIVSNIPVVPTILPVQVTEQTLSKNSCPVFTKYLKVGDVHPQVRVVEEFLKRFNLFPYEPDLTFDNRTKKAVEDFQRAHSDAVLAPWGISKPTGRWYITTRSYANKIMGCLDPDFNPDLGDRLKK